MPEDVEQNQRALIGFRRWKFDEDKQLLRPIAVNRIWDPEPVSKATCRQDERCPDPENAPNAECTCGIYAYYSDLSLYIDNVSNLQSYAVSTFIQRPHTEGVIIGRARSVYMMAGLGVKKLKSLV